MNIHLAFLLSVSIWVSQFCTFAFYVNTQSIWWQTMTMITSLISMILMWTALGILEKKDFIKETKYNEGVKK
jgi:nicotinamide riboside transporter PnuC